MRGVPCYTTVGMRGVPWYTPVGMLGTSWYTPVGMLGTSWYTLPGYMVGIHLSVYAPPYAPRVYHRSYLLIHYEQAGYTVRPVCPRRGPGL